MLYFVGRGKRKLTAYDVRVDGDEVADAEHEHQLVAGVLDELRKKHRADEREIDHLEEEWSKHIFSYK